MPRLVTTLLLLATMTTTAFGYTVANGQIRDSAQRSVQLRGINWFGFETEILIPHGLWTRNWKEMIDQLQGAGFNAIRLPLCPAAIRGGKVGGLDTSLNADLADLNSQQVMDAFIKELDARGIYILLDHHRPNCTAQSELWYTDDYSEQDWIADLVSLAARYKKVPHVLGLDLKNEPHGAATWGTGNKTTDWNLAAERASAAVLAEAPGWLVFVEGIGTSANCTSGPPHFWGENLEPLNCTPLNIPRSKLVLSPHAYGPDVAMQPYFKAANFPANMPAIWDQHFGQHALRGHAVVVGEFGGGYGHCVNASDRSWQNAFVQYLIARGMGSAFYWSLNPNSGETGGLLQDDWKTFWPDKLALLKHLHSNGKTPLPGPLQGPPDGKACTAARPPAPTPLPTGPATGAPLREVGSLTLKPATTKGGAQCREGEVRNTSGSPIAWRVRLPVAGRVGESSGVTLEAPVDAQAWAQGTGPSATLAPGERARFSYCVLPSLAAPAVAPAPASTPAPAKPAMPSAAPAPVKPVAPASSAGFSFETTIDSEWDKGYCSRVRVTNTGAQAGAWKAVVTLRGRIQQLWKARYTVNGSTLTAEGEDYNRVLKPGESTDFGFCAAKLFS